MFHNIVEHAGLDQADMDHIDNLYELNLYNSKWASVGMLLLVTFVFIVTSNIAMATLRSGKRH